ncbi:hypothetical protein [Qipengyuania zhejiangensis]|uniref:hypothetical protein n=1 Tax=Qipengyuania zhejiangensis TaxID=3077782 RepID=UPI002D768273|nr:hypothetical protein [Qipengyuania sp. Z2]
MNRPFATAAPLALILGACGTGAEDPAAVPESEHAQTARGSYDIDPSTGETRARFEDDDGKITTMVAGDKVPLRLPAGFTLFPGARVTHNTRVERADGSLVLVDMETDDSPEDVVSFYREQAQAAGYAVDIEMSSGAMMMVAGKARDGSSFSFTATRKTDLTQGQLSVGVGLP